VFDFKAKNVQPIVASVVYIVISVKEITRANQEYRVVTIRTTTKEEAEPQDRDNNSEQATPFLSPRRRVISVDDKRSREGRHDRTSIHKKNG